MTYLAYFYPSCLFILFNIFNLYFILVLRNNSNEPKNRGGVTGGDKGLQGVTKNYRKFFLTRTFPDTFC